MSLISAKNFVSPFQNHVHLITLVMVAALFGAYRLAGLKLEVRPPVNHLLEGRQGTLSHETSLGSVHVTRTPSTTSDLLDEALQKGESERIRTREAGNANQQGSGNSLDDIEKRLGLR